MEKLVSIDLKADFGFLKKPDINGLQNKKPKVHFYLSYNMLHKPALLGIFGAILGYEGYIKNFSLPDYYLRLQNLRLGIQPLESDKGSFDKLGISYTNTTGFASDEEGGTLNIEELTLIRPSYRVFIALPETHSLYQYLKKGEAEYIPYLGKNEYPVWWKPESFKEYELKQFDFSDEYEIKTLFIKNEEENVRKQDTNSNNESHFFDSLLQSKSFFYFERLPIGFQEFTTKRGKEYQYSMASFVYSNALFSPDYQLANLYILNGNEVVQLN